MAFGLKARDPETPYLVYAFAWNDKIYYVGLGQAKSTRHTHRWLFIKNLLRHEAAGTLRPDKRRALEGKSNKVIASLQRAGCESHEVRVLWRGVGRANAEIEEAKFIAKHVGEGCALANVHCTSVEHTVDEIVNYLGVRNAT